MRREDDSRRKRTTAPSAPRSVAGVIRPLGRGQLIFDLVVAGVLFLISIWSVLLRHPLATSIVVVLFCAALAVRRLSPTLAVAGTWAAALIQIGFLVPVNAADLAVLGVAYASACYGRPAERWTGLGSSILGGVIAAAYMTLSTSTDYYSPLYGVQRTLIELLAVSIGMVTVLALSWTLGLLTRIVRQSREAKIEAAVAAQRAAYETVVEQERTRIARDMHDVVAHSLAVVIAQADGARYAGQTDPAVQNTALGTISATARSALAEVRQLLTQLRHEVEGGPQPGLADLPVLVEGMRAAGLRITETTSGVPVPLLQVSEIAAYRVLQESLTNALRHGDRAGVVTVELRWEPDAVHVRVANATRADSPPPVGGSAGHGLPGMRERATLAGGSLAAGSVGNGMYEVTMMLPAAGGEGKR